MTTIFTNRSDGGMADDKYAVGTGQFSVSKHFDILTYPGRLVPMHALAPDTTGTGVCNLQTGSDGQLYGLGLHTGHSVSDSMGIWIKPDNASPWAESTEAGGATSSVPNRELFVEYNKHWFSAINGTTIRIDDPISGIGNDTHALAYTNVAQGFVHPKVNILYIPYDNKIASFNAATSTWNNAALTLPSNLRITSLTYYGNLLAIAAIPVNAGVTSANGGAAHSIVYLWNLDETVETVDESIDWGTGVLQVLNNLDGVLVGISDTGGASHNIADRDSITIKLYDGSVPRLACEISTDRQDLDFPDAAINPRVDFIFRNRLYFSADIVGGGSSPALYGLWSFGKNKTTGRYAVCIEQSATTDDSEESVIAAAIVGDYTAMVHTAPGTLTFGINSSSSAITHSATSYLESGVNPGMPTADLFKEKQLVSFCGFHLPLRTGEAVTLKYRVDGGDWIAVGTNNTVGTTFIEQTIDAAGDEFTAGRDVEFRLESTGGVSLTGFSYRYNVLNTLI